VPDDHTNDIKYNIEEYERRKRKEVGGNKGLHGNSLPLMYSATSSIVS